MKISVYIFICLFLSSLGCPLFGREINKQDKVYLVNKIRGDAAKTLSKRHCLEIDQVGANMRKDVELIYIDFNVRRTQSLEDSRRMIVDCVDEVIKQANSCPPLLPYFKNGRCNPENVSLFFEVYDGKHEADSPDFVHIGFNRGELYYKSKIPRRRGFDQVIRETYEEAKARLENEK